MSTEIYNKDSEKNPESVNEAGGAYGLSVEHLRTELMQEILCLNTPELLREALTYLRAINPASGTISNEDLTTEEKKDIDAGLKDLQNGHIVYIDPLHIWESIE